MEIFIPDFPIPRSAGRGEALYLRAMRDILLHGVEKPNRTGISTRSMFAIPIRFPVHLEYPLLTTKKMAWESIKGELVGFVRGYDNAAKFRQLGTKIWDQNANEEKGWLANPNRRGQDDLGRVYGVQWRDWRPTDPHKLPVDQLAQLVHTLRTNPNDRRMIVTAWNPGELDQMALPPCHMIFQCYVANGAVSMQMTQRSCDWFLGVPFNIASYALLLHMIAHVTGHKVGELVIMFNDAHIYKNHEAQCVEQLTRMALPPPQIRLSDRVKEIWDFTPDDIELVGYNHLPAIKADMAV